LPARGSTRRRGGGGAGGGASEKARAWRLMRVGGVERADTGGQARARGLETVLRVTAGRNAGVQPAATPYHQGSAGRQCRVAKHAAGRLEPIH
jgi:hypothetical protein